MSRIVFVLALVGLFFSGGISAKEKTHKKKNQSSIYTGSLRYKKAGTFRERLARKINDIERVDHICKEYKIFQKTSGITPKELAQFEEWCMKKAYYIGSKHYNHKLIFESLPKLAQNSKFKKAFWNFIIAIRPEELLSNELSRPCKRVTILYTGSFGGGHSSPAKAIGAFLEEKGIHVQLIDIDDLENLYSPQVEGFKKGDVYGEIFQKRGDTKKAAELWRKLDKAQTPEMRKYLGDLKKYISDFHADHIFAVAHQKPSLAYVSYQLGIPLTYVHTDHVFHRNLVPIIKEQALLKHSLIHFTALSSSRSFVKGLYKQLKVPLQKPPKKIEQQLLRMDFPVRESFKPVTKKKMDALREKLGVPSRAIMCKLAMGQNATTEQMNRILKQLMKEEENLKRAIYFFVICGKNTSLQQKLTKFVHTNIKTHSNVHFKICGFMEEKEMAEIDCAADIWITKPGGSTCAELLQTQKQMLYVISKSHSWEVTNAEYLKKHRLAEKLDCKKPIIKQILRRYKFEKKLNYKTLKKPDWKGQLTKIIAGTAKPSRFHS